MANTASKPRILCVEDHADCAALVCCLLGEYDVTVARGVNEALFYASGEKFDLCLLDYNLPDGDGAELFRLLKPLTGGVPAIFTTGSPQFTRKEAIEMGARDLLEKGSYTFDGDLVSAVKRLLATEV